MNHQHPTFLNGKPLLEALASGSDLSGLLNANLDGCGLSTVPPGIFSLPSLTSLSLYDNLLTEIPTAIAGLRGLRTLDARLGVHGRNAEQLANWLSTQPGVSKVYYPGLPTHPGHDVARRQQSGFGAIVTIELAGGTAAVKRFVDGMQFFSLAESLGGVESLVAHPGSMTHAAMAPEARAAAGLVDGLLRLSIGIESVEDLREDLAAGLDRARRA